MNKEAIPQQRDIIDRRALSAEMASLIQQHSGEDGKGDAVRQPIVDLLRQALDDGRAELAQRLEETPSAGHECCAAQAFLVDQIVRLLHDHVVHDLFPVSDPSTAERLSIMALGGYGRAEMAPHSDVDIGFLIPSQDSPWCKQVIETMLYFLWDLGLNVGHSSRTPDDVVRMARDDLTIQTAMLEGRYVWGDRDLYSEARERFFREVVHGHERDFVTAKLAERDARHRRMGNSRYVVEPNVKDGKGGLRDLHTLYWIGKFIHRARSAAELVDAGLFTSAEYRSFRRAESFMLAVRCHLHFITGRAEDRLTFDLQREVAERMRYADRKGKSPVERFMQMYFIQAKRVGSLTGVFLAHIDERFAQKRARKGFLAGFRSRPRSHKGYQIHGGRIAAPSDNWFQKDPVRLIEIFQIAEAEQLEIDPETMRKAGRDAKLIRSEVQNDPRANALFVDLLSGRNNPEAVLRWMNEAGVFGRFVPDFGKVNAQMQFDMYHHYTVDEHTIRAIGLLSKIERGELSEDHPRSTRIISRLASRKALYIAVLLHDIAKGRGGDHSVLGAEVAMELCPRFGLDEQETELVAWLVRQHLLMSATAQKRDLTDPKTIEDFCAEVQGHERLRNLMLLTVVDIRAVGPGTWNDWKRQLLGELYDSAQERLRLGHVRHGREHRIGRNKASVAQMLEDDGALVGTYEGEFPEAYWIAEPEEIIVQNLIQFDAATKAEQQLSIRCDFDEVRGATLVSVIAADHPGLFYRIAGGIHLAGGNIIDARIHTTSTGWAVDNFLVQDPHGGPFHEPVQLERIEKEIEDALANRSELAPQLARRPLPISRSKTFKVRPRVLIDNKASNRYTVIEVNARDRPALLNRLARTLFDHQLVVHSAHVTAYGERAADTFYITDLLGGKLTQKDRMAAIKNDLLDASSDQRQSEMEEA